MADPVTPAAIAADERAVLAAIGTAYERGRLRWALPRGVVAGLVAVPALIAGAPAGRALLLAVVVVAAAIFAGWRSRGGLLGSFFGAAMASVPLVMGVVVGDACACTGSVCLSLCGVACASCSVVVGGGAGYTFGRLHHGHVDFVAAAIVAAGAGFTLCPASGMGSIVGAVVGAAVALPSAAILGRASQQKALA